MGAKPYSYFVAFENVIQSALDKLRTTVFERGDYSGVEFEPASPVEALELMEAEGTASILDIKRVVSNPDFCCASPFTDEELRYYFGTTKPTRQDLSEGDMFWDDLERGQARIATVFENGQPDELYFVGYSFD